MNDNVQTFLEVSCSRWCNKNIWEGKHKVQSQMENVRMCERKLSIEVSKKWCEQGQDTSNFFHCKKWKCLCLGCKWTDQLDGGQYEWEEGF